MKTKRPFLREKQVITLASPRRSELVTRPPAAVPKHQQVGRLRGGLYNPRVATTAVATLAAAGVRRFALRDYPFPQALADLSLQQSTGTLTLSRGGREKRLLIKDGAPVDIESNIADEALDQFLVKRKILDAAAAFQAKSKAVETSRPLGDVLIESGVLGPNELFKLMKRCMGGAILSAFRWPDGDLLWEESPIDTKGKLLLKVNAGPLVVRGVCSYAPFELISQHFLAFSSNAFRLGAAPRDFIPALQLSSNQARIARALEQPKSVNELAQCAEADMETVLRLLYALLVLRVAVSADAESEAKFAEHADTQPQPAPIEQQQSDSEATASAEVIATPSINETRPLSEAERKRICEAKDQASNHYQLLQVPTDATFAVLKTAFLKRCDELSPMSFREREVGELQPVLEELFLSLVRAFSTLAVSSQRKAYDQQIGIAAERFERRPSAERFERRPSAERFERRPSAERFERRPSAERFERRPSARRVSAKARPSQDNTTAAVNYADDSENPLSVYEPYNASVVVKTGIAFLNASQPREAAQQLQAAISEDPNDAYAMALLGYALYLCDPISNVSRAMHQIQMATTADSKTAEPYLLLGRIFEQQQDRPGALDAYERCLSRDPKHKEAQAAAVRLRRLLRKDDG